MPDHHSWMPVFSVIKAPRAAITFNHPDNASGAKPAAPAAEHHDFYQRVGTAFADPRGGFVIHLTALPLNGTLVVRPPGPSETMDPTSKG